MPKRKRTTAESAPPPVDDDQPTRRKSSRLQPPDPPKDETPSKPHPTKTKGPKKVNASTPKQPPVVNPRPEKKSRTKTSQPEKITPPALTADESENAEENQEHRPRYWLMKAEPTTRLENGVDVSFSIDDLASREKPEPWDGMSSFPFPPASINEILSLGHVAKSLRVRDTFIPRYLAIFSYFWINHDESKTEQARNKLREMKKGDLAFFYHSNCKDPGIVGTMRIVQDASPDRTSSNTPSPYRNTISLPTYPSPKPHQTQPRTWIANAPPQQHNSTQKPPTTTPPPNPPLRNGTSSTSNSSTSSPSPSSSRSCVPWARRALPPWPACSCFDSRG